ncbi:hypothetical protein F5887DRAFT_944877, partial [Amanita rubescens]
VYKSRWNTIKVLYLLCRFMPLVLWLVVVFMLVTGRSPINCTSWVYAQSWIMMTLQFVPECLLLYRAWAFCGQKKPLTWLFCMGFTSYVAVLFWGYSSIMKLNTGANKESRIACIISLSNARHAIGFAAVVLDVMVVTAMTCHYSCNRHFIVYICLMAIAHSFSIYSFLGKPHAANPSYNLTLVLANLLCELVGLRVIVFTGNSILDLRREVNPNTIQILEKISLAVRDARLENTS